MSEILRGPHCSRRQTADGGLKGQELMQSDYRAFDTERTWRGIVMGDVLLYICFSYWLINKTLIGQ